VCFKCNSTRGVARLGEDRLQLNGGVLRTHHPPIHTLRHAPAIPLVTRAAVLWVVILSGACTSSRSKATASPVPVRCTDERRQLAAVEATFTEEEVDEPVRMIGRLPRLPLSNALLDAGHPQSAVLAFVVDTTGQVDPCSVEVRAATHPDFRDALLSVVPQLRFTVARRAGKLVRQRASMPVTVHPAS